MGYAFSDKTKITDGVDEVLVSATGRLLVETQGGAGGTSAVDDAAFTPAVDSGTPIMGTVTADTVDSGDVGVVGMTAARSLHTTLRDSTGDSAMDDANNAVRVNIVAGSSSGTEYTEGDTDASITGSAVLMEGAANTLLPIQGTVADGLLVNLGGNNDVTVTGTVAVQENGSALTSLQLIDDIVYTDDTSTHSTGNSKGALIMAAATPTDSAVNANDIGAVAMTTDRKLHVSVQDALPAGTNAIGKLAANSGVDIGDVDVTTCGTITPGTAATSLGKAEDGGHTTGDVGVMMLGVRNDTPNATVTSGDADYGYVSLYKTGSVRPALLEDDFAVLGSAHVKKYYTNAGAVTDGIVWSPASGKRWYVTDIFLNVSAAATVTLEDDLVAGDSVVWKAELAANSGWSHHFGTPLFSGEDAADLLVTTSAGNVYITVTGYEI